MGAIVWELEGPGPTLKSSKMDVVMGTFSVGLISCSQGFVWAGTAGECWEP